MDEIELFGQAFLKKLKMLQILSKKVSWGTQKGEHTSPKRGRSLEFSDFRNYVLGDDIRYIDWNIYGRLDKLFLKLFIDEVELTVYLLIDTSASMAFGSPQKLLYAKQVAASLCFIALSNFDRVGIVALDEEIRVYQPPVRGCNEVFHCFGFLKKLEPRGKTDLGRAIFEFGKKKHRPGLVIIISDFLQEQSFFQGLNFLLYQKNQLFLIQLLDLDEMNPDLKGDLKLVDIETEDFKEVSMSEKLIQIYKKNLDAHCKKIQDFCGRHGIGFLQTTTDIPFEEIILKYLRMGRLLA